MINPEKISILERTHRLVTEYLSQYPPALASVKPDEKAFSAVEIVCHLRDVESLWHSRFEKLADEGEVTFVAMNPDKEAIDKAYNKQTVALALQEWTDLRMKTYELLKTMDTTQINKTAIHPRYGAMELPRMLDIMINHDLQHLEQMKRTLSLVSQTK